MRVRHALTGAIYTKREDGLVEVTQDGKTGVFETAGRYVRGDLHFADPHMLVWLGGEDAVPKPRRGGEDAVPKPRRGGRSPGAPEAPRSRAIGVAIPQLGADTQSEGKKGHMDLGLAGKKVLVTAATRGIGLAIAETFADAGCDVAICARGEAGLESARKSLESRGGKVFARAVDVSDGDAFKQFVADAAAELGGLDIFVSNASAGAGRGEKAWQANFDIDVMGAVRGVEAALPSLIQSEAASVVFISSTAALEFLGVPQAYNAMKAALISHAGDLSQALASQGVRVNVISPGPIYFEGGNWEMIKQTLPQIYDAAVAQCAIGRMGSPEEVARATVFLASPAASLITGANLVCDGGFTKRTPF